MMLKLCPSLCSQNYSLSALVKKTPHARSRFDAEPGTNPVCAAAIEAGLPDFAESDLDKVETKTKEVSSLTIHPFS